MKQHDIATANVHEEQTVDEDLVPVINQEDWEVDPDRPIVRPRLGAAISLRLDQDDARLVRRAAQQLGTSQSEFVRNAARVYAQEVINTARRQTSSRPLRSGSYSWRDDRLVSSRSSRAIRDESTSEVFTWLTDAAD